MDSNIWDPEGSLLLVRDALAEEESRLSPEEKQQLPSADQRLLEQAAAFHAELVCDALAEERQRRQVSPERWWWYLDVVRVLPLTSSSLSTAA